MSVDFKSDKDSKKFTKKDVNSEIDILIHKINQPIHCLQLLRTLFNNQSSPEEIQILFERLELIILDFKEIIHKTKSYKIAKIKSANKDKRRTLKGNVYFENDRHSHKDEVSLVLTDNQSNIKTISSSDDDRRAFFTVFMIDDDELLVTTTSELLKRDGFNLKSYRSAEEFIESLSSIESGCLIVDQQLSGMSGLALIKILKKMNLNLPSIMITGFGDIKLAVNAMKAGAIDFVEKPFEITELVTRLTQIRDRFDASLSELKRNKQSTLPLQKLTKRELEILENILTGLSNKVIARKLNISHRTVENHRASIMKKTKANSVMELARIKFQFF
jgi:FixJ family two-component response regulator